MINRQLFHLHQPIILLDKTAHSTQHTDLDLITAGVVKGNRQKSISIKNYNVGTPSQFHPQTTLIKPNKSTIQTLHNEEEDIKNKYLELVK